MSYTSPEELAVLKSLSVRPWCEPPQREVPAGHVNRSAVRAASKRAARKSKRERKLGATDTAERGAQS